MEEESILNELRALVRKRCRENLNEPTIFALWWSCWVHFETEKAFSFLEKRLQKLTQEKSREYVEQVCDKLREWLLENKPFQSNFHRNIQGLVRLIPLMYEYIRPEDDVWHERTYSPGVRDHCEELRNRLIPWLADIKGEESVKALRSLASDPRMEKSRKWLLHLADQRVASNEPCAPMSPTEAFQWSKQFCRVVNNTSDLFEVALFRLDDIRLSIENDNHSYRELFNFGTERITETPVQNWLASMLREQSRRQYTVSREEEVDYKKKPDIRISNPSCDGPISIEVKIAERWSGPQLVEMMSDQLVDQYMNAIDSNFGIYLLFSAGERKMWRPPGSGNLDFKGLLHKLQELADEIVDKDPRVRCLRVVGIDSHKSIAGEGE